MHGIPDLFTEGLGLLLPSPMTISEPHSWARPGSEWAVSPALDAGDFNKRQLLMFGNRGKDNLKKALNIYLRKKAL